MMVVVTVMVAGLHLHLKINCLPECVKYFLAGLAFQGQNGTVRFFRQKLAIGLILAGFAWCAPAQERSWERASNTASGRNQVPAGARVDINRASLEELMTVPGMTASWAGRIVRFRPYHAKNELVDRGVLSAEAYERIRNYVIAHRMKKPEK